MLICRSAQGGKWRMWCFCDENFYKLIEDINSFGQLKSAGE